ncbi:MULTISPECIES: L-arabinonate dehydratase [unclassified Shinella]|uniref:L-arabinonate dehydratase n=1 Tax=unclassified Shinella TaxID=2643062 RepID=UPI00225C62B7|nr:MULTISPECIES: L-arabinonate dehydratase [unclassified Shinella]MCO5141184.1 L-arabinonate dehydratase [Shinella sp.]MDC7260042.1 dihydroxy-acid dehydratase [Shinella sp. YE25]CAI0341504.1 6-deoxy-6-sulfo-D-gluconate dehydratase [Rhizobiaceae bacterium]CAK7261132.1 6-deoxy-6-sulfo-D-gluconate dehydratase [Shinella sp. WSC3-e]
MSERRDISELRSQRWFATDDMRAFAHRQRTQQMGMRREEFMGRPVIGIINTWSEMSPCHAHLRDRAEAVKRGVWQMGGYPVELPAISVGEVMVKPTTMLYRNFLAMECEELLRCHPIDGAVLLGGCDKSTPALLMGAFSMDIPVIFCPAGPMSNGQWRGIKTGAGTHTKKYWDELRAGNITREDWVDLESRMTRSPGTCNTIGTASTMTSIVDAMGMTLSGASSIPAVDSGHSRMASACGSRIVEMVWEDLKPSKILDRDSFLNGLVAYMALGGSTNAAVHLIAMAKRVGVSLTLDDMAEMAGKVPVVANVFPSGEYLMEDFYFAGGVNAMLKKLSRHLKLDRPTVNGRTLGENIADADCWNDEVIRGEDNPVVPLERGKTLEVLHGNLAPNGAVMKSSAANPKFLKHIGPAIVFDDPRTMNRTLDDPDLDITEDTVIVLRNAGPVGAPGMPEWGNLPIPKKLLKQGVRDMVRICDGRMSGTHYGTCILHVSPEAAVGGPLALVRTGDLIELDVAAATINMRVSEEELARRRAEWKPSAPIYERSFAALYQRHVSQAHEGCDFDFLTGTQPVPEPPIY